MLSAADAGALGESADGLGKSATSLPLAGPDEQRNSDGATGGAVQAVAAPLPPTAPATVDPAMLLAQGALSVQAAPASAAASTAAAATAVALGACGGIRSAPAERFGAPVQRLAGGSAGATVQPANPAPLAPANGSGPAAAAAMASAAQTLEVPATSVKPHDALVAPAAPVQPTPFAGAAALVATGSAAGPADLAPDALSAPAVTPPAPIPVPAEQSVTVVVAQATRPPVAGSVNGATSPGFVRPDAPSPKSDEAEALRSGAVAAPEQAIETTGPVTAVGVTERSATRLLPAASGTSDAAGSPQGKRDAAIESALLRVDAPLLAGRFGRDKDLRSDRDGNDTPGAFVLPAVSGAAPVGAVAPIHAAQAANLHAASVERIVDQIGWWLAQNAGSAEFSIDMPGGQPLSVSVQVRGNEAQLIFRSDQPELRQLIGQALPQLKESFVQEGLLLAGASVSAQAGGADHGNHGGQAQPVPYHTSGRPHGAEERATAAVAPAPASAAAGRRAPFGAAGRSLDLYV